MPEKIKYKVWLHLEVCDEENDSYEESRLPSCIGEFETEEEANTFFDKIENNEVIV